MDTPGLKTIKKQYAEIREQQRKNIIDYLAERKDERGEPLFTKISGDTYSPQYKYRGGSGKRVYGWNRFEPVDLSYWKWVETKYRGHYIMISLQSFEIEPTSGNLHVLLDRIGLLFDPPKFIENLPDNQKIKDTFLKMEVTDWDLPLSESDLNKMTDYIVNHFEADNKRDSAGTTTDK